MLDGVNLKSSFGHNHLPSPKPATISCAIKPSQLGD
jgi:hypothetical protein